MYTLYLSKEQRQSIIADLTAYIEETKKNNKNRLFKAQIGLSKFKFIFRDSQYQSDELIADLKAHMESYYEYVTVDDKPEKGERKMADEQALLIADIIDGYLRDKNPDSQESKNLELFKICLLEQNYEQSNYNFDVQLSLLKTFDKYGLSTSFSEAYDTLDIKGVQLESLGYISSGHALRWAYFTQFDTVYKKLLKYVGHNARDLSDSKKGAMEDKNFAQMENFIEYETHLGKSYYTAFVTDFLSQSKNALTSMVSSQTTDDASDFYSQGRTYDESVSHLDLLTQKNVRTQDVKQYFNKLNILGLPD